MITIVDYNAGNLRSVKRACDAVGLDAVFTADPATVRSASKIIFPGVGAAASAMQTLNESGLGDALRASFAGGTPILGVCLGCQIILDASEEGDTPTLGLIPGSARRFQPDDRSIKVPHMGWNEVRIVRQHPLLEGIEAGDEFYFVHSYYPAPAREEHVFAVSDHGQDFCCALGRDNLFATQFHPEKSGPLGLKLLARFADWDGQAC
jgi:glutamine amidotransferase